MTHSLQSLLERPVTLEIDKNLPWDVIYFSADQGHRKKLNVKFSHVKSQIQNGGGQATGIKCQDFECVCEVKHFPLSQVKHKLSFLLSRNLQLLAPPSGSRCSQ